MKCTRHQRRLYEGTVSKKSTCRCYVFPAFYDLTSDISRNASCNVRQRAMDKGRPESVGFDEIINISQHKTVLLFFFPFCFFFSFPNVFCKTSE